MIDKKSSKILLKYDGINSFHNLKDYVIFEDDWISEHDEILIDKNNVKYCTLDFKIVEK